MMGLKDVPWVHGRAGISGWFEGPPWKIFIFQAFVGKFHQFGILDGSGGLETIRFGISAPFYKICTQNQPMRASGARDWRQNVFQG